jgi:hypothetical protein
VLNITISQKISQKNLSSSAVNVVWWDGGCDRLNDAELVAFREFRKMALLITIKIT